MNKPKERGLTVYVDRYGLETKLSFDLVKAHLVVGRADLVTPGEMMHFIAECKARQLNPYRRDCYLIKFSPNETGAVVTSKDYFVSRADAQRDLQYWQAGIVVERECRPCNGTGMLTKQSQSSDKQYSMPCKTCDAMGIIELHREGALPRKGDTLIGGWFKGKKASRELPMFLEVDLQGYIKKTKEGRITQFWSEPKQPMMIRKVALSQGLRELYPDEFKGLYDAAEVSIEEPLPEEAIDTTATEVTPARDLASEINLGEAVGTDVAPITPETMADVPEIFGEEPPQKPPEKEEPPFEAATEGDVEQAAKEAADQEVQRRAYLKTFDVRLDRLDEQRRSIAQDLLFEDLEAKDGINNLEDLKIAMVEAGEIEDFMARVDERYDALDAEPAPLTTEPPPTKEKEQEWLDPREMLAIIEKSKTGGMKRLVGEWGYMFDNPMFHAKHGQIIVEFASKYHRLVGTSLYDAGQPWEHPPSERSQPPATPGDASYITAIEDMQMKMANKLGEEQAHDEFMKQLGLMGYEDWKTIPTLEHRKEFFAALGETLKD